MIVRWPRTGTELRGWQKSRWHAVIQKCRASDCGTRWLQGESRLFFLLEQMLQEKLHGDSALQIDLALELSIDRDFLPRFCDINGLQPKGDMLRMCSPAGREGISGLDSSEAEGPPGVWELPSLLCLHKIAASYSLHFAFFGA